MRSVLLSMAAAGFGLTGAPGYAAGGGGAAHANTAAQTGLRRWLWDVTVQTAACVRGYSRMGAQIAAASSGSGDAVALDGAAQQERRACQYVLIPRLPAVLAHDTAARHASAAVTRSTDAGWTVAAAIQDMAEGNTNAHEVRQAINTLRQAISAYRDYTQLAGALKHTYHVK